MNKEKAAIENKIPTNYVTRSQLLSVEAKTPNIDNIVDRGAYEAKIKNMEGKLKNHGHDI